MADPWADLDQEVAKQRAQKAVGRGTMPPGTVQQAGDWNVLDTEVDQRRDPNKLTGAPSKPGILSNIYNATIAPFVEHPLPMAGAIAGGVLGTAASVPQGVITPGAIATRAALTGYGGAFGQAVEDLFHGIHGTQSLQNQFNTFMQMAAASGAGDLMERVASSFALRGVPAAEKWLAARRLQQKTPGAAVPSTKASQAKIQLQRQQAQIEKGLTELKQQGILQGEQPISVGQLRKTAQTRGPQRQATAYRQWKGVEEDTRLEAGRGFKEGPYHDVLEHPDNLAKPGELELYPSVGETAAITNKVPMKAAVDLEATSGARTVIDELVQLNKNNPFPAKSPLAQLISKVNSGERYVEYDTLRKAVAYVKRSADPGLGQRDPTQGLSTRFVNVLEPVLDEAADTFAQRAGVPPEAFNAAQDLAIQQYGKYKGLFRKPMLGIPAAKTAYDQTRGAATGKTPGYGRIPGSAYDLDRLRSISHKASDAVSAAKTAELGDPAWLARTTKGGNAVQHLERYLSLNPGQEDQILYNTVDKIFKTQDWNWWAAMQKNDVLQRLLPVERRDLINSVNSIMQQLQRLEADRGPKVVNTLTTRVIRVLQHKIPGSSIAELAGMSPADLLQNPETARRFNMTLMQLTSRLPQTGGAIKKVAAGRMAMPTVQPPTTAQAQGVK